MRLSKQDTRDEQWLLQHSTPFCPSTGLHSGISKSYIWPLVDNSDHPSISREVLLSPHAVSAIQYDRDHAASDLAWP